MIICRRANPIVFRQRQLVVFALISKYISERFQTRAVLDLAVPIIMPNLMPEMSQDRPVRFGELRPPPFTLGVIGFGDI